MCDSGTESRSGSQQRTGERQLTQLAAVPLCEQRCQRNQSRKVKTAQREREAAAALLACLWLARVEQPSLAMLLLQSLLLLQPLLLLLILQSTTGAIWRHVLMRYGGCGDVSWWPVLH